MMVKCSVCAFVLSCVDGLKMHLKYQHHQNFLLRYNCGENECSRSFSTWKSYRSHLVRSHKCPVSNGINLQLSMQVHISNDPVLEEIGVHNDCDNLIVAQTISSADVKSKLEESAEILVAKLYKNPSIPRNFVQSVLDDFDNFIGAGFLEILQAKVLSLLTSDSPSQSSVNEIMDIFEILKDPFKGLSTDHRRMVHFKSSTYYVHPETYVISESRCKRFKTHNGSEIRRVKTTGQFIPLRKVLRNLFELPQALSETLEYVESLKRGPPEVLVNVIQCPLWKQKISKFQESDIVFPLYFYFDEFEANAALGPHSEKLGAGYIVIPVLPPQCRSKLENILLAVLFDSDDRKPDGADQTGRISYNKEAFAPLIKELNFLETEGILCSTDDLGDKRIHFVLAAVTGDNLGVHGINGFAEGFTANFPCTVCKAPKELTWSMISEDVSLLRDPDNYAADVLANDLSATGVKEECVFNSVHSFHVTENIIGDIMHDGAEGGSHYVMIPILKHCIDVDYFTIDHLNSRMALFDYGPKDSSNKPPCIRDDFHSKSKLKMTASEMVSFVRLFGVLVGDLVPETDQYWRLYNLHKELMEILLSRYLPSDIPAYLDVLVQEHHSLFLKLTGRTLPPKLHYIIHYRRIIATLGPAPHYSSMRGEAKHRNLTNYTKAISSRRNLPLSAALKHQLGQCFRFATKTPLMPQMICGPGESFEIQDHCLYYVFKSSLPHVLKKADLIIQRLNWVDFFGTRYEPQMVLVTGVDDYDCLNFGKIVDIFLYESKPLFVCKRLNNIGYNEHVGGYEVLQSERYTCVYHCDLYDP